MTDDDMEFGLSDDREREPRKYKIVLFAAPGITDKEVDNAETVLEAALAPLNAHTLPAGFRFADHITADLEVERDVDTLAKRVARERDIAYVIACGYEPDSLRALAHNCARQHTDFCNTAELSAGPTLEEQIENLGDDLTVKLRITSRQKMMERTRGLGGNIINKSLLLEDMPASPEVLDDRVNGLIALISVAMSQADYHKDHNLRPFP